MQPATSLSPYGQALELIATLPLNKQEELVEIVRRRMIEQRRAEIAQEAVALRQALEEGRLKPCSFEELKADLLVELES
ncbi:MAG: hypothetical protein HOP19_24705 [Acidobacteria bacterium]|nr:hypothetical protein [Acidobacteriota bacterium]